MLATQVRLNSIVKAKRIVVKVGTHAITDAQGRLDARIVADLAAQLSAAIHAGKSVTLVASGAIGAGMAELDLPARPKHLPQLQATAAVGQGQLMRAFYDAFAAHNVKVAQVLVTRDAFEDRGRYLNIRNTLTSLDKFRVLPILNENDAVAVDEIRFGDNDIIAALVANMLGADLLVLLTSVEGVMKDGQVVDVIEQVDDRTLSLASASRSRLGSGGMGSKMTAAGMVTHAGDVVVIASSRAPGVLTRLLAGEKIGTLFVPAKRRLSSRRRWIGQASKATGKIVIDEGASRAIRERGKSLLPSGILAVSGKFAKGATVTITDSAGRQVGRGLAHYSAEQIDKIKGLKSAQVAKLLDPRAAAEVIHRNDMMLE